MAKYSQEDADEVFRHVDGTLTAAISFLVEMKSANPEDAKRFTGLHSEMIGLHASLEALWMDYDANEEQEGKEQEQKDIERAKKNETLARAGADKIIEENTKAEAEEENEQNEKLWEDVNADYRLPSGWPLDYPK
jgi:hypothetical protein